MTIHNFHQSLAVSHQHADAPWWQRVYAAAFPGFGSMLCVRNDGWAQRGGVDRVITLKSGRTVTVDEKVRTKDWGDILLERWSDKKRRIPGWVQKDLACDYIAYAFIPSQRCYMLPFLQLRKAWTERGREWIARAEEQSDYEYTLVEADNGSYVTESIAVPIPKLMDAISDAMVILWTTQQRSNTHDKGRKQRFGIHRA